MHSLLNSVLLVVYLTEGKINDLNNLYIFFRILVKFFRAGINKIKKKSKIFCFIYNTYATENVKKKSIFLARTLLAITLYLFTFSIQQLKIYISTETCEKKFILSNRKTKKNIYIKELAQCSYYAGKYF